MSVPEPDIDGRIGARIRTLRAAKGLTLDALARQADVSRAMLSRIERGESSPTAQLLNKVCGGLGVTLSALFAEPAAPASPLARRRDQPTWRDPASGYLRRNVSPPGTGSPVDITEVTFPPGGSVAFDHQRLAGTDQHIWVLDGILELELDGAQRPARHGRLPHDALRPADPVPQPHRAARPLRRHHQPWSRPAMTGPTASPARPAIRALDAAEAEARLDELADILVDAVAHGASVNFLAGFSHAEGRAFWRGQIPGIAAGGKRLFVADDGARLLGTVLLMFAPQPNAPHRAEIGKMLVLSTARRHGLGRRLLTAAEAAAAAAGRTLLMLDTESGSAGDRLYRSCGWTEIGRVPDHSFTADGRLSETTLFYKRLD